MKGHVRVGVQVGQPASTVGRGDAADVDPTVDVVKDDLQPSRFPALPSPGRDIDGVPAFQRGIDRFFCSSHINHLYQSRLLGIPPGDGAGGPSWSKFSGASHASN